MKITPGNRPVTEGDPHVCVGCVGWLELKEFLLSAFSLRWLWTSQRISQYQPEATCPPHVSLTSFVSLLSSITSFLKKSPIFNTSSFPEHSFSRLQPCSSVSRKPGDSGERLGLRLPVRPGEGRRQLLLPRGLHPRGRGVHRWLKSCWSDVCSTNVTITSTLSFICSVLTCPHRCWWVWRWGARALRSPRRLH